MCGRIGRCDHQDAEAKPAAEAAAEAELDDFEEQEAMTTVYRGWLGVGGALGSVCRAHGAALGVWPDRPVHSAGSRDRPLHFSCVASVQPRLVWFFTWISCLHIITELSYQLQLHLSTSPDTPPVGPTALRE